MSANAPFRRLDPRLGNYDDLNAATILNRAAEWLFTGDLNQYVTGWRAVDSYTIEFRIDTQESGPQLWSVIYDVDGAPDGPGISILSVLVGRDDA